MNVFKKKEIEIVYIIDYPKIRKAIKEKFFALPEWKNKKLTFYSKSVRMENLVLVSYKGDQKLYVFRLSTNSIITPYMQERIIAMYYGLGNMEILIDTSSGDFIYDLTKQTEITTFKSPDVWIADSIDLKNFNGRGFIFLIGNTLYFSSSMSCIYELLLHEKSKSLLNFNTSYKTTGRDLFIDLLFFPIYNAIDAKILANLKGSLNLLINPEKDIKEFLFLMLEDSNKFDEDTIILKLNNDIDDLLITNNMDYHSEFTVKKENDLFVIILRSISPWLDKITQEMLENRLKNKYPILIMFSYDIPLE